MDRVTDRVYQVSQEMGWPAQGKRYCRRATAERFCWACPTKRSSRLHKHLRKALADCGLPKLTWYQSTRHTFASQFILGGGSIELLSKIMGHASVTTTEHYSHLRADLFAEKAFDAVTVDLSPPKGDVVSLQRSSGPNEYTMRTAQQDIAERKLA